MGLFDNLFSSVTNQLPTAAGNGLGDVATKVQESASKITSMFGGAGPFSKVASIKETVSEGAAKYQLLASQTATEAASKFAASNPFSYNSITGKTAAQVAQSQLQADATAAQIKRLSEMISNDHYVQLTEIGGENNEAVVFLNMPDIAESRTVEYEAVAPPQSPAAFQKYKGTSSVQWTLNATLTSRTTEEATTNLLIMNRLRGWTMPYFGDRSSGANGNRLGAPPPVLELKGWRKQMVGPVPVVITSLNWTFPQDVDYIPANELGGGEKLIPFPTVLKVSIAMVESFSTGQMNSFDLDEFRMGNFYEAWRTDYTAINELNNVPAKGNQAPAPEEGQKVSPGAASSPGIVNKLSPALASTANTTISSPTVLNALPPAAAAGAPDTGKGITAPDLTPEQTAAKAAAAAAAADATKAANVAAISDVPDKFTQLKIDVQAAGIDRNNAKSSIESNQLRLQNLNDPNQFTGLSQSLRERSIASTEAALKSDTEKYAAATAKLAELNAKEKQLYTPGGG